MQTQAFQLTLYMPDDQAQPAVALPKPDQPSPWFLPALQLHLAIPVLPHWACVAWAQAISSRLVRPVETSFGPAVVWKVNTHPVMWEHLVQRLVKEKRVGAAEPLG